MNDLDFAADGARVRLLDPVDRISEILFGLFMVLTFTGTLSVATAGREEVRGMMVAALGCNIAWGLVDGVMYILRNLIARGRKVRLVNAIRQAPQPEHGHRLIRDELGGVAPALTAEDLERLRRWILAQPDQALPPVHPTARDLLGALAIFLLVVLSTFPVVLPFVLIADAALAKRVSAVVAIAMLFLCGYVLGRYAGLPPRRAGGVMVLLGLAIEAIVIALGG